MNSSAFGKAPTTNTVWIALIAAATIAGSLMFACATPFAAVAALAALHMRRSEAFLLVGLVWGLNQLVGYGLLSYPQTWDSLAWGAMIGMGALAATAVAIGAHAFLGDDRRFLTAFGVFGVAFVTYQLILYAATAVLPSHPGSFAASVVFYVLVVNTLAFLGLTVLQHLGAKVGLAGSRQPIVS
jgi:hypothetical protein